MFEIMGKPDIELGRVYPLGIASSRKEGRALTHVSQLCTLAQSSFIFLDREAFDTNPDAKDQLSACFDIADRFWSSTYERHNGYYHGLNFPDASGNVIRHVSSIRIQVKQIQTDVDLKTTKVQYEWANYTFHTIWEAPGTHFVLCFDIAAQSIQEQILRAFEGLSDYDMLSPCAPLCCIAGFVNQRLDESVWAVRDWIREIEKIRGEERRPEIDYQLQHELSRHSYHATELCSVGIDVEKRMYEHFRHMLDRKATSSGPILEPQLQELNHHWSYLTGVYHRSVAIEQRLNSEKNLTINMVAQSDSAVMRAIAVLTLMFLPSAFVSTFFSMTFFQIDNNSGKWSVSGYIWLYFIFTAVFTAGAFLCWRYWRRRRTSSSMV